MKRIILALVLALVSSAADAQVVRKAGSIAALSGTVELELGNNATANVQVTGTWVGTLEVFATNDLATWVQISGFNRGVAALVDSIFPDGASANGIYTFNVAGYRRLRVQTVAYTSGSVTLNLEAAPGAGPFLQLPPILGLNGGLLIENTPTAALDVTGPVTDIELRASAVPVSLASVPTHGVTGTFWQATQPVSGTFWQATQPVSLATAPTTPVTGTFWQATQPVSGTFWQATQPVSGPLTDTQLRATPVPVSGTVSATVSGTVTATGPLTDTQLRATPVPVSGTVTATTGGLTDTQLRATAVPVSSAQLPAALAAGGGLKVEGIAGGVAQPVSGTFFQATQPVSLATAPTTPVTGTFWQATQPVSGTFFQATQPVSIASMPSTPVTGTFFQATQPVSGTVTVTQATLTKGTQGATGVSTQDLKDAGRSIVTLTAERVVPILTTDTIVTFSKLVGDTVTAAQTTYAVTAGKTLRLTALHLAMTPTAATAAVLQVRLRTLSSGACTVAAGVKVGVWEIGNPIGTMVANQGNTHAEITLPDGLEFSGATRNICISANVLGAAAQAVTVTLLGYEY